MTNKHKSIQELDNEQLKTDIPEFDIGDTLRVSTKIVEGEKERIQAFQGTVIARKGRGLSETFSLHRVSYGEGMERVFFLHSPRIVKFEVVKKGDVRRAKLYYLRGTSGKKAKVKEKIGARKPKNKAAAPAPTKEPIADDVTQNDNSVNATESVSPAEAPVETTATE